MASIPIALRVPEQDLREIDRRAAAHGRSRTAFLIEAALSEHLAAPEWELRLEEFETRLGRLEELEGLRH